jgi:glycosyltransferase involved in cell wall biosynthesis
MGVQPLVSIVTPTLDQGPRLKRCLDSIGRQTYPNIEHIVVDGGSTDGTTDLLRSHAGLRWVSEPDDGQSAAINKGWSMASGSILGWLNGDDELEPRAVARVVAAFQADARVGWVYGDVKTVEAGDVFVRTAAAVDRPNTWSARNLASQPGSFNAAWALEKVGLLDERFHYMMDLDLWLRLIDAGIPSAYIPEVLATFEVHGSSKSGSVPRSRFVLEEAFARTKSGRRASAAVALGRAAALLSFEDGHNESGEIRMRVDELLRDDRFEALRDLRDRIAAGADAESSIEGLKRRDVRAVLRGFTPRAWRFPESRARLRDAGRREASRLVRRIKKADR